MTEAEIIQRLTGPSVDEPARKLLYELRATALHPILSLGRVALEAQDTSIANEVIRHWIGQQARKNAFEPDLDALVNLVITALDEESDELKERALRVAIRVGYRDRELQTALKTALTHQLPATLLAARLIDAAGVLRAVPASELDALVRALSSREDGSQVPVARAIACYAEADMYSVLELLARRPEPEGHEYLACAVTLAMRHKELLPNLAKLIAELPGEELLWFEGWIARNIDDNLVPGRFLNAALDSFASQKTNTLYAVNLLRACVRPDHLKFLGSVVESEPGRVSSVLAEEVSRSSENLGRWDTAASIRKESALALAGMIGLPQLRDWTLQCLGVESSKSLLIRHAEDAALWNIPDSLTAMGGRLEAIGDDSVGWLVFEECAIAGGEATLRLLLQSEGRINEELGVTTRYTDALAYAASNIGSTRLLHDAIDDSAQPEWRREAAALAIRTAIGYEHKMAIDWDSVAKRIRAAPANWTSHELLIAMADVDPNQVRELVRALPPEARTTRIALAGSIAGEGPSEVLEVVDAFLATRSAATDTSFDGQYAALTLANLLRNHAITETSCLGYLRGSLARESVHFMRACAAVETTELADFMVEKTLESNDSWRTHGAYWEHLARLCPDRFVSDQVVAHVAGVCGDSAVWAYLEAALEARTSLSHCKSRFEELITRLSDRGRGLLWKAAFFAAEMELSPCPVGAGDTAIRWNMEQAFWRNDESAWQACLDDTANASWAVLEDYYPALSQLREELAWADEYWVRLRDSNDRLSDWRYAQALLKLPSERIVQRLREWEPQDLRDGFFRTWLAKLLPDKVRKHRERLWLSSVLPGEDSSPRS